MPDNDDTIWGRKERVGPSAGLVQRHYVEARQEALYRRNKDLEKLVAQTLIAHPALKPLKLNSRNWMKVYDRISARLQSADLTINFNAGSWFATENHYESYTQTYQRSGMHGTAGAARAQLASDGLNPALKRSQTDDDITFKNLVGAAPPVPPRRGLAPGRQDMSAIQGRMEFRPSSTLRKEPVAGSPGKTREYADSSNRNFNPNTKQVFAALNYGRRIHGSTTAYGRSHLILNPKFKLNALYYPGDTFYHQDASKQTAYHVIGSIVALASPMMVNDIIQSCYFSSILPDTGEMPLLLEAHIFEELPFKGNVQEVVLAAPPGSAEHANAKKFAVKHGARLTLA